MPPFIICAGITELAAVQAPNFSGAVVAHTTCSGLARIRGPRARECPPSKRQVPFHYSVKERKACFLSSVGGGFIAMLWAAAHHVNIDS
jgi:hypothetical protein